MCVPPRATFEGAVRAGLACSRRTRLAGLPTRSGRSAGRQFTSKLLPDSGRSSVSPRRRESIPGALTVTTRRSVLKKYRAPPLTFALSANVWTTLGCTASGVASGICTTAAKESLLKTINRYAVLAVLTLSASAHASPWTFTKISTLPPTITAPAQSVESLVFEMTSGAATPASVTQMSFLMTGNLPIGAGTKFELVYFPGGLGAPGVVVGTNDGATWGHRGLQDLPIRGDPSIQPMQSASSTACL